MREFMAGPPHKKGPSILGEPFMPASALEDLGSSSGGDATPRLQQWF